MLPMPASWMGTSQPTSRVNAVSRVPISRTYLEPTRRSWFFGTGRLHERYTSVGRRIGTAILAVLTLAGCAGPTAASHTPTPQQPSPSPYPSPSDSPVAPPSNPPTPTPVSSLLQCRLPISAGQPGSGGFVVFPGGQFVADPTSNVVIPNVPSPSPGYGIQPGNFIGLTYDRPYKKWLPVPRQYVSPDGSRYVFIPPAPYSAPNSIFVESVTTGARTELGAGMGRAWNILDVESEGVYATAQQTSSQAPAGLWLLPFSGAPRQITATGYWQAVGGGAAYGFEAPSVPTGAVQRLMRLDLKTGTAAPWFDNLPLSNVIGFDLQGHPILTLQVNPQQVVELTGSNAKVTIYDGSVPGLYVSWGVLADSNGIWLASGNGLYIYRTGTEHLEQASAVTGPLAGACV